jgi:hypothetical protein
MQALSSNSSSENKKAPLPYPHFSPGASGFLICTEETDPLEGCQDLVMHEKHLAQGRHTVACDKRSLRL